VKYKGKKRRREDLRYGERTFTKKKPLSASAREASQKHLEVTMHNREIKLNRKRREKIAKERTSSKTLQVSQQLSHIRSVRCGNRG